MAVTELGRQLGLRVVAEGVQKARQGMTVKVRPFDPKSGAKPEAPSKTEAKPAEPATQATPTKR